jgi:hypothetical protein
VKAPGEVGNCRMGHPFIRYGWESRPKPLTIEAPGLCSQDLYNVRAYIWINTGIKIITGSDEMGLQVAPGTTKHVPMIDKYGMVMTLAVLPENGLAVIRMPRADVEQPGQPEIGSVADAKKAACRKDFKQRGTMSPGEARSKAKPRPRSNAAGRRFNPATRVVFDELGREPQEAPSWYGESGDAVQLRSHALIEQKVWALGVVSVFNHVNLAVAGHREKSLRASADFTNELRNDRRFVPLRWHESPKGNQK